MNPAAKTVSCDRGPTPRSRPSREGAMPKPKDSLALYELFTRHPPKSQSPARSRRWAARGAGRTVKAKEQRSPGTESPARSPKTQKAGPSKAPAAAIARLARNPARLSAVIGAVAIVAFAGYLLDRRWGFWTSSITPADTGDGLEWARRQPPQPGVLTLFADERASKPTTSAAQGGAANERGSAPEPAGPSVAGGQQVERQKGLNYIVVESFARDRLSDARAAQDFLAGHGIETTIETARGGWILVTAQGFGARDPARQRMVERITQLGKAFFEQGGRYRFICYAKLYQGQPW